MLDAFGVNQVSNNFFVTRHGSINNRFIEHLLHSIKERRSVQEKSEKFFIYSESSLDSTFSGF